MTRFPPLLLLAACAFGEPRGGVDTHPVTPTSSATPPPAGVGPGLTAMSPVSQGRYVVPMGPSGMETRFDRDGAWMGEGVRIALAEWGRTGQRLVPEKAEPGLGACASPRGVWGECVSRLEYAHGSGLTAWWIARDGAVEQGFDVASKPAGSGPLVLEVGLDGASGVYGEGRSGGFTDAASRPFRVLALAAWDADHRSLSASMTASGSRLRFEVDDSAARYPVTIDPIYDTPILTVTGEAGDALGTSVAGRGDLNGDGYDDIAIGAPGYDGAYTDGGAVHVYYGSAAGLSPSPSLTLDGAVRSSDAFGSTLEMRCDFDSDGYADLAVGAPHADDDEGADDDVGTVFVYWGSSTGIDESDSWEYSAAQENERMTASLACVDDTDGDGYPELAAGSPEYDDNDAGGYGRDLVNTGKIRVFYGGTDRFANGDRWEHIAIYPPHCSVDWYQFGWVIAGPGDTNGDGYSELLTSEPEYCRRGTGAFATESGDVGKVFVLYGTSSGLTDDDYYDILGAGVNEELGYSLAGGDFNGDGYGDIVYGTPHHHDPDKGALFLRVGSADGLGDSSIDQISGENNYDRFAETLANAGDVNNDGYDDLLASATDAEDSGTDRGKVYLYTGSASGLTTSAAFSEEGAGDYDSLGQGIAGAGDVDGNGYGEILVGAPGNDSGGSEAGRVYVWRHYGVATDVDSDGVPAAYDCDDLDASIGGWQYYWEDDDFDGYGDPDSEYGTLSCSVFSGVSANTDDCDDSDASVNPGEMEICDVNDVDEDCNGLADDEDEDVGSLATWYYDADGDGYGTSYLISYACSRPDDPGYVDGDSFSDLSGDCDEENAAINPSANEVCDASNTDEDCNGFSDDEDPALTNGAHIWSLDADGDGYGQYEGAVIQCDSPGVGYVTNNTDCDDTDPTGGITQTWYLDFDGDGYGSSWLTTWSCGQPDDFYGYAFVANDWDCDDNLDYIHTPYWYYLDDDGDGYGQTANQVSSCEFSLDGYAQNQDGDCDDTTSSIHPGASEVCDGSDLDEDCDGLSDDADEDPTGEWAWYRDADGDGHGSTGSWIFACDLPSGYVADADDCNDSAPTAYQGAIEVCDASNIDEDCDGLADNDDGDDGPSPASLNTFYLDNDGDAFGDPLVTLLACDAINGYVSNSTDCNDADPEITPWGIEVCDDGNVDENCNGVADDADPSLWIATADYWHPDTDGDGYGSTGGGQYTCDGLVGYLDSSSDCNDADASIRPGLSEVCDGVDQDCDGEVDDGLDTDGDGTCDELDDNDDGDACEDTSDPDPTDAAESLTWEATGETLITSAGAFQFGGGVALSESVLLGGGWGTVRGYQRSGTAWSFIGTLTPEGIGGGLFGMDLDLDGDRALLGSPEHDDGPLAVVFERGINGFFTQDAILLPSVGGSYNLDMAVALDGDVAVLGRSDPDQMFLFEKEDGVWSESLAVTSAPGGGQVGFGSALSLDGDRLAVGAPWEDGTGAVYLYEKQGDGSWEQTERVQPAGLASGGAFGYSLDLDGDRLLVGAPFAGGGVARVFQYTGGGWTETEELTGAAGWFGEAVALDGHRMAVSGEGEAGMMVHLYALQPDETWEATSTTTITGSWIWNAPGLELDGDAVAVGTPSYNTEAGAVYVDVGTTAELDGDADGEDDDCDPCPVDVSNDFDGDGWCGTVVVGGTPDCDDGDPTANPTEAEICNDGVDNNCDGEVDEGCEADCSMTLSSPAPGADLTAGATFLWTGDCAAYRVEVSPDPLFPTENTYYFGSLADAAATNRFLVSSSIWAVLGRKTAEGGYWRVIGGLDGLAVDSETRSFTTTLVPLPATVTPVAGCVASLTSPAEGSEFASAPTFRWSTDCPGAVLEMSTDPEFPVEDTLYFGSVNTGRYTLSATVWDSVDQRFGAGGGHWRVTAGAAEGAVFSEVRAFTVP